MRSRYVATISRDEAAPLTSSCASSVSESQCRSFTISVGANLFARAETGHARPNEFGPATATKQGTPRPNEFGPTTATSRVSWVRIHSHSIPSAPLRARRASYFHFPLELELPGDVHAPGPRCVHALTRGLFSD